MAQFNMDGDDEVAQSNPRVSQMVLARSSSDSVMVDALALINQRGARTLSWSQPPAFTVHPLSQIAVRVPVPHSGSPPDSAMRRSMRDRSPRRALTLSRATLHSRSVVRQADTNLAEANCVIHKLETELNQARAEFSSWHSRTEEAAVQCEQVQVQKFELVAQNWMSEAIQHQQLQNIKWQHEVAQMQALENTAAADIRMKAASTVALAESQLHQELCSNENAIVQYENQIMTSMLKQESGHQLQLACMRNEWQAELQQSQMGRQMMANALQRVSRTCKT